jgi:hypothetical protein
MDKPKYIPVPRSGTKCAYSGLSRSGIYNLISPTKANGYAVVVSSTEALLPGKKRGRRMICYESLMGYLKNGAARLRLRQLWSNFRSSRRRAGQKPLPIELPTTLPDDLPEDAVFFTSISYKIAS